MRHENIVTPVTSKSEGDEGKRNRKTRIFSALLSASALGVFLEGCGGADTGSGSGTSGAEASGVGALAASSAVTFAGSTDIVSEGSAGTVSEDSTYIANPISSAHAEPDFFTGFDAANTFSALIFSGFSVDDTLMRGADTLQGDANVDTFAGGAGADIIDGRAGADILNGGADADTILGGDGNDTMHGDTDADTLRGGKGGDTMYGGAGADILLGGDGDDTMHGDAGADTYMFNAGDGTDTITDNGGRLVFLQGANRVYAGATYTFVYGQGEAVTLTVSKNGSTLNVIEFTSDPLNYDFFTRSGSIDTLIPARLLVVPLRVGSEETPFVATADADIFAGSEIYNWVSYAESDEGVTIDLSPVAPATATVSGGWARGDTLTAIRNLIGSSLADTLIGNGADNNFRGGEGADTLNGGAGEGDTASYEFAKEGVRVTFALTGEQQSDFDGTHGFAANNNEAVGDILTDIEHIKGSNFNDWLTGDALKNILRGLGGNDRLEGGGDNDELYGGEGDDTLVGDEGEDILDGGAGTDTVAYQYVGGGIRVNLARTEAQIDFDGTHGFNANDNDAVGDTLANIENIRGSNFADWLTGDDNDNKIQGETGNDRLDGGAGADTYLFGAGDGTDTISDDGEDNNIVFLQGTGNAYAGATYTFVGGQGDAVTLTVRDSNSNTLNIIEFTSYPSGYSFSTRVYAGDGSYTDTAIDPTLLVLPPRLGSEENPFVATDAPDTFVALQGADWVNYAGSEDGITIYLNDDPIYTSDGWADGDELSGINNLIGSDEEDDLVGNSADNIIRGGDGDDTITGEEGEDTLQGGDGNDMLQGNEGADTIDGGAGTKDIATYGNSSGKGVRVSLLLQGQGQKQIDFDSTHGFTANGNEAVGDTLTNIENLEGSDNNDWLTGDNNDNEIHGRNGNDRLEGNAGNDALYGNFNDDALYGGEGDDFLEGGLGADILDGGEGEDTAYYDSYPPPTFMRGVRVDLSNTEAQQDFETNSFGFNANDNEAVGDVLTNIENIEGSRLNDWLTGNYQNNILRGLAGNDRLEGGMGADTLYGGAGADTLEGGIGNDELYGDAGTDTLEGGVGADTLYGGAGADTLEGGVGADTLYGDAGADTLEGGMGNDELYGGAGADTLVGGADADTYIFRNGDGTDTIADDGGTIVFLQGTGNAYAGATYTFVGGQGEAVTLTVRDSNSNTLNIIEFTSYPSGYSFSTRVYAGDGSYTDTAIDPTLLVLPARLGSEENPFVATDAADTFAGSEGADWVSYANLAGVNIDLSTTTVLTGINNLIGSNEADLLVGNGVANILRGGDGNDFLEGRDGADTIDGDEGRNFVLYLNAGSGVRVDLTLAGAQQDFETNNFGFTANQNEAVGDTLINIENIVGSDHNDWLTGNDNDNLFLGEAGDDRIDGGGGDDGFLGGLGADTIDGGAGEDTAFYNDSAKGIRVSLLLQGQAQQDFETNNFGFTANNNEAVGDILINIENLFGSRRDDWLTGDANNNELFGYADNDRLEGGAGDDTYLFNAGDGTDTIIDDGGNIVFDQGINGDYTGATYTYTRADGGRGEAVTLTVRNSSNTTINVLKFAGDPSSSYTFYTRVQAADGSYTDTEITLPAVLARLGSEENPFVATDATDIFVALQGADWASYAGSTAGVSIELDDNNPATLSGGWAAGDTLTNINNLIGSDHADSLSGNGADNILRGGLGADILEGGAGADILDGGADADEVSYSNSLLGVRVDLSNTGAQQDFEAENGFTANNNEAEDDILTNIENIRGSDYNDWLTGNDDANRLVGGAGDDRLEGGADADTLEGGLGADTLVGGADADTYIFRNGDGTDTIIDDGGAIVFVQGTNNAYAGATYTYTRADGGRGEAVTLTVYKDGNTLNVLEFASDPSSSYTFYTRSSDGTDTAITLPAVPARLGSEGNPFVATDDPDTFVALQGADWASYAGSTAGVTIELDDNNPATLSGGWAAGDALTNINNLIGSDHADSLSGNGADNILRGGLGADILEGGLGADTLDGGADADEVSYSNSGNGVRVDLAIAGAQQDFEEENGFTANDNEAEGDTLIDIEHILGSSNNDWLTGDGNANRLVGGVGDDRLEGGDDNDELYGGAGDDALYGDAGFDTLDGGLGADNLDGGDDTDEVSYSNSGKGVRVDLTLAGAQQDFEAENGFTANNNEAEDDILTNIENIRGSDYNDWLAGDDNANTLYGLLGNDRLEGGADADTLDGGLGADTLVGGADADTYIFRNGDGTDTIIDDGGAIVFVQGTNNDYVGATYTYTRADGGRGEAVTLTVRDSSSNTLNVLEFASDPSSSYTFYTRSSDGTDTAITLPAVPARLGSEENPFLATDAIDIFVALQGAAWASYAGSTAGVTIELDDNNPATLSGGWATGDALTNINNLIGSDHADSLSGNGADNILRGGLGADILEGGLGADTLDGGADADEVSYSNSGNGVRVDLALAGAQQDFETNSFGFTANDNEAEGDTLIDIEHILGSSNNDWLTGDGNANRLVGGVGDDRLEGGDDNDELYGGAGDDALYGDAGFDTLDGGLGADTLDGGDDTDEVSYSNSGKGVRVDLSNTGAQQDFEAENGFTANNNEAEDDILTNIENIRGSDYNDWLAGDDNANTLYGLLGNDRLEGGADADILDGGLGADTLVGGAGADTYIFRNGDGTDTIIDDGGAIVFAQGTSNDYAGATYTYTRVDGGRGEAVILTVRDSSSNTLNVLEFASDPSSIYTFYTRSSDGTDTAITLPAVPARLGSEENPFVATDAIDIFVALQGAAWASYAGSTAGVSIELDDNNPATLSGGWATGDALTNINNLIGSDHADSLSGNGADNILRGGLGADILEGGAGADILEGGAGKDDYVFDANSGDDTIKFDADGGRLLFRDTESISALILNRNVAGDVTLSLAGKIITIDDSGTDDAYQQGSYSVHDGAADTFFVNIYIGENNIEDTIKGSGDADLIVGLANNDFLYGEAGNDRLDGGAGNDQLYGGANNDRLDGGAGNDRLDGGSGADKYIFDANDGLDTISSSNDGLGNKLVFRAQPGNPYTDANFAFAKGDVNAEVFLNNPRNGEDLRIIVSSGAKTINTVYIEDYFTQTNNNAYTIYRTTFGSQEDGQIVSTMGFDETS